eukprot:tig00001056_g6648.t1
MIEPHHRDVYLEDLEWRINRRGGLSEEEKRRRKEESERKARQAQLDRAHRMERKARELFQVTDLSRDGWVDYHEMALALRSRNILIKQEEVQSAFKMVDKDGNCMVDVKEFVHGMTRGMIDIYMLRNPSLPGASIADSVKILFAEFGEGGPLKLPEFERLMRRIKPGITTHEILVLFLKIAPGKDGAITLEMLLKATAKGVLDLRGVVLEEDEGPRDRARWLPVATDRPTPSRRPSDAAVAAMTWRPEGSPPAPDPNPLGYFFSDYEPDPEPPTLGIYDPFPPTVSLHPEHPEVQAIQRQQRSRAGSHALATREERSAALRPPSSRSPPPAPALTLGPASPSGSASPRPPTSPRPPASPRASLSPAASSRPGVAGARRPSGAILE